MIKFIADKTENITKQICRHSGLSFAVVQKKLRKKEVVINGKRVSSGTVSTGDEVVVFAAPKKFEPKIVFEDENVAVINKPRGIESEQAAAELGLFATHRLDRNTAGVLMLAKSEDVKEEIMQQSACGLAEKTYLAKVFGQPNFNGEVYSAFLEKRASESFVKVFEKEKQEAVKIETVLKTLKKGAEISLVEAKIKKGKTHQIRAHLAFLGFAVVGDEKYGSSQNNKKFKAKYQELYAIKVETNFKGRFEYLNKIKLEAQYELEV